MDEMNRRTAFQVAAAVGVATVTATNLPAEEKDKLPQTDRERVLAIGMTEDEADCWELAAKVAGKFFELPKLHPMDTQEVASAIHIIQNKLLSRPTYRQYLELAKKAAEKKGK